MDRKQSYLAFRIQRQEKRVSGAAKRHKFDGTEGNSAGQIRSRCAKNQTRTRQKL